ncbi:MAG: ribosomal protein S18-alanine N-acetyltransferase [Aquificaceae bacterium]|jgi:ribosomal-protein-alanine N-acetyltransferase|uniref:ribosomal protein S18-alanine N-acetyltransferase n=1 Tax=Hydrogenobacter sp. Uz 6-8 TaxID=3384828 RepID=UPI000F18C7E7|nr:MAG: ribosomal-protein-alanine N-acetyltransferase [Aquificota bacterium]
MIREMRPEDIEHVLKINEECFNSDAWSRKAFEREFELDYSYRFVLEEGGTIIGYAVVWKIYDDANLMSIAVRKDLWGRGYGKKLMEFLVEYFRDKAQRILLDVRRSNIRAIRLYQSLGFKIVSERNKYYSDGENAFQMMLELEEEDEDKGKTFEVAHTRGKDKAEG